jgi:hypothetical protein
MYSRCTQPGVSCWMAMEGVCSKYCDVFLTVATCNSRVGTSALKYTLHYSSWHLPDAAVFQWLEQHVCEIRSVIPMTHMNAGCPWTTWTLANVHAICHLWNESNGEAHVISYENWDYSNQGSLKHFTAISFIHATPHRVHPFPIDSPLQVQFCEWLWQHSWDLFT